MVHRTGPFKNRHHINDSSLSTLRLMPPFTQKVDNKVKEQSKAMRVYKMHLGHQTAVRTNVPMFFDVLCCDSNGVPKCRVLRQIASHMGVGLYV